MYENFKITGNEPDFKSLKDLIDSTIICLKVLIEMYRMKILSHDLFVTHTIEKVKFLISIIDKGYRKQEILEVLKGYNYRLEVKD